MANTNTDLSGDSLVCVLELEGQNDNSRDRREQPDDAEPKAKDLDRMESPLELLLVPQSGQSGFVADQAAGLSRTAGDVLDVHFGRGIGLHAFGVKEVRDREGSEAALSLSQWRLLRHGSK